MSAVANPPSEKTTRIPREQLLVVPALLALALPALAFLPENLAAQTATRIFIVLLLLIAAIDMATLRVPNLIIYPAIVFALIATAIVQRDLFVDALVGWLVMLGIMFGVAVIGRGAMGMGDVKAGSFVGCCFG